MSRHFLMTGGVAISAVIRAMSRHFLYRQQNWLIFPSYSYCHIKFCIFTARYQQIWVLRCAGYWRGSNFNGNCHTSDESPFNLHRVKMRYFTLGSFRMSCSANAEKCGKMQVSVDELPLFPQVFYRTLFRKWWVATRLVKGDASILSSSDELKPLDFWRAYMYINVKSMPLDLWRAMRRYLVQVMSQSHLTSEGRICTSTSSQCH